MVLVLQLTVQLRSDPTTTNTTSETKHFIVLNDKLNSAIDVQRRRRSLGFEWSKRLNRKEQLKLQENLQYFFKGWVFQIQVVLFKMFQTFGLLFSLPRSLLDLLSSGSSSLQSGLCSISTLSEWIP